MFLLALASWAQRGAGELRLKVVDPTGLPLEAALQLTSQSSQVRRTLQTAPDGTHEFRGLPFGVYVLEVSRDGFSTASELIEVRSEVPMERRISMGVAAIETTLVISDASTLIDPHQTGMVFHIGAERLRERRSSAPGRAVLEQVERQPGWVLEANGILHPRGSEYDTQYVIDGVPLVDNRSPAFAPPLEIEQLDAMKVFTANYPAEYGRKLGGVIEVSTASPSVPGFHGKAVMQAGSFSTANGFLSALYARGRSSASIMADGLYTERYLDPPAEANYTNKASGSGLSGRWELDTSAAGRLRFYGYRKRLGFLVPNEEKQEEAGQRQDRRGEETLGQFSYQHVISPRVVASGRTMVRDLTAELWSNPLSTPILADQDRGFREGYFNGSVAAALRSHELKFGSEAILTSLRERFGYRIAVPEAFDDDLPLSFRFADSRRGREHSAYIQDVVRLGQWTLSAGLRWDRYTLLVTESALSPRLGLAWHWPGAGMVFRASYDRAFQIPASENLLLASSDAARHLTDESSGLPVPPSRGNFYQVGFSKGLFGRMRLDAAYFRRDIRDFADDDPLLNTGVSFPISFSRAEIHGTEVKLELPSWGAFSGFVSYSNLTGTGHLPITGGLFLEDDAAELLQSNDRFPISQDQRNTLHARLKWQAAPRLWFATGVWYASGLPMEREDIEDLDLDDLDDYSPRVLNRVNFERGRVRPSHSIELSTGLNLWTRERRDVRLQFDVLNLTNRLNVINFAGLFSGTALYPPRTYAVRLHVGF